MGWKLLENWEEGHGYIRLSVAKITLVTVWRIGYAEVKSEVGKPLRNPQQESKEEVKVMGTSTAREEVERDNQIRIFFKGGAERVTDGLDVGEKGRSQG